MSRFAKIIIITFLFIGLTLCAWMVRGLASSWFEVDQFVVHPSDQFSQEQQQAITAFFQQTQALKTASLDQISSSVRGQFPSVGRLALSQDASGQVTVFLEPVRLQSLINEFVVSQDGQLFKKQLFHESVVNSLVTLYIPCLDACCMSPCALENKESVGALLPEIHATVCKIPTSLLQRYNVSCRNQASWLLVDKQEQRFAILFHGTKIPDEKVIATCGKLKGTLDTRGVFTAANTHGWVADVRFENQIVLFRNVGGNNG